VNGERETLAISDFLLGPMTTALQPGDLLLGIELAKASKSAGSAYCKWGIVRDALPTVGVATYVGLSPGGNCAEARIAVGGLADGPKRASGAERLLANADLDDDAVLRDCARKAAAECETSNDHWLSAEYKTLLVERLCLEMLGKAIARARGVQA
jgi:carbon-monoxide dehydrogenase medium subunit